MKDLVRINKPEILLVQETKLEGDLALQAGNLFWKKGPGKAVSSRGALRGLATFWDSSKFDLLSIHSTMHWIFTIFIHKDSGHHVCSTFMFLSQWQKKESVGSPLIRS